MILPMVFISSRGARRPPVIIRTGRRMIISVIMGETNLSGIIQQ
jgi:hypothetical protein